MACTFGDKPDVDLFIRLHTDITINGLYDILELQEVHSSWRDAAIANMKHGD